MSLKALYTSTLMAFWLVLISFGNNAQAQQPAISLPNTSGGNGTTATIPINLSNPSSVPIAAFAIEVSFNNTVLQLSPEQFDTTGTLCRSGAVGANCSIETNITTSGTTTTLRIVAGTSRDITTSGVLLNLLFNVVGSGGSSSPLTFVVRTDPAPNPVPIYEQIANSDDFPFDVGTNNAAFTVTGTTSASVTVSGRVLTSSGRGLRDALVRLTLADGTVRTASSASLGNFRFPDIQVGQTVTIQIISKRYDFQPQTVNVTGEVSNLDFIAEP